MLLPRSVVSSLQEVLNAEYELVGYSVEGVIPVVDMERAIEAIENTSAPATPREVGELVAELFVLTKQRREDQMTLDISIEAFGSRLLEYPADIVREVLKKWPDRSTFFPSWHELKSEIDWRNKRGMMKVALEKKLRKATKVENLVEHSFKRV